MRPAGIALCACGWRGHLGGDEPCRACGRPATDRITPERLAALRALDADSGASIEPRTLLLAMRRIGLIAGLGRRPTPGGHRRHRPPKWPHVLTPLGRCALTAALQAEQTRADVAAAAARHAEIGTLIARSSVGGGLQRIREHGIEIGRAHV